MPAVTDNHPIITCEEPGSGSLGRAPAIQAECAFRNKFLSIHSFSVGARAWKVVSPTNRFVDVAFAALTEKLGSHGKVLIFLEVSGKHVILPFQYYQLRKPLTIKATWENGRVFVSMAGNFVLNINAAFTFKVLLVEPKTPLKYREFAWHQYELVKKAFKLAG